jgi:serine-type D-Ala-D-Ala carboxypeptidase/endopeptidase (penicillin-binding protein 4)
MKFLVSIACLYLAIPTLFSQNNIQRMVEDFSTDSYFKNAAFGFKAVDLSNDSVIASYSSNTVLSPASTTKLFSTAMALELLGKDFRPLTRIYIDGKLKDSIVQGNIWIRGGADVSLGSRYYNADGTEDQFLRAWADSLISKGIKGCTGNLIADASEYGYAGVPDGWTWNDIGNYFGAGPSGLCIYDNILRYYFKTSKSGSKASLVETFPSLSNLSFDCQIRAGGGGDNSTIYGSPFSYIRYGTGYLEPNRSRFMVKGSLPDPELQFATECFRIFQEKGFRMNGIAQNARLIPQETMAVRYPAKTLIYTHQGKTLESIVWWTNQKSVNVFAETCLFWAGYKQKGAGSITTYSLALTEFWKTKINLLGANIVDGSGLSRNNAISCDNFISLLKYMNTSKETIAFYSSLSVAGVSGTLSNVCKGQLGEGRIHAKSGTLNRVKSFAGYIESICGKKIAFCIILNDFSSSNDYVVDKMEKIFNALANH